MQTRGLYINIYEKGRKKEEKKRPSLPWHFRHFRAVCRGPPLTTFFLRNFLLLGISSGGHKARRSPNYETHEIFAASPPCSNVPDHVDR